MQLKDRRIDFYGWFNVGGSSGSVADFKAIAAWIFEEDRIIPGTFIITRPFDILSASLDGDLGEPVYVTLTLRPERNPALIRNMMRGFCDAEELCLPSIGGLKRQPTFNIHPVCESQCRQEEFIKFARLRETADPHIHMIVSSPHSGIITEENGGE